MKKVAFLLGLFAILFASCSLQLGESKTSARIQLPSAREIDSTADEKTVYDVEVSLSIDGVVKMQTGTISAFTESTFTFNEIEIGASAVASCEISANGVVVWQGTSEQVTIKDGINISIQMKNLVFTQETFRALLPGYATNTKNEFAIPEGYTKIIGVTNSIDANNSPNMESVFKDWAALSLADALPTIKIPSSVVYIDAAAFYGLHNEGKPFVTLEFEDTCGWVFTGTMETYNDAGALTYVDVKDYYSLDFNEYLSCLIEGKGYIQKFDSLSVDLPISDNNFGLSVKNSEGNFIEEYPISKGTTLVFGIEFFMNDNNENGSTFVPSSYKWYIDGVLQENETGKTFTWDTTDKASGTYEIMCVIDDKYSAIQTITLGTRQE